MLTSFAALSPHLKLKFKRTASIDNLVFKLHYRATFLILLVCTILVTSRQYIGDHIRCIVGPAIPEHVINTFCFFTTTFTVVRHFNESMLQSGSIPHPGIGIVLKEDTVKYHAYYQWVPFLLFGQGLIFRLPHLLWKSWEGGKIKSLVNGLQMISISKHLTAQGDLKLQNQTIPSQDTVDNRMTIIKTAFFQHIRVNNFWASRLILCECLNLINLLLHVYFTNRFLGGQFYTLGINFLRDDFTGQMDVLDFVFPKVTKCHFHKYGPSGSIQTHDALCVMALNVINEKIFVFLWFWFLLLGSLSILALIWRFVTMILHSRSAHFNRIAFAMVCPRQLNPWDVITVTHHSSFSDWLFLYYLAKNMEAYLFRNLVIDLATELRENEAAGDIDENDRNASSGRDEVDQALLNKEKKT